MLDARYLLERSGLVRPPEADKPSGGGQASGVNPASSGILGYTIEFSFIDKMLAKFRF